MMFGVAAAQTYLGVYAETLLHVKTATWVYILLVTPIIMIVTSIPIGKFVLANIAAGKKNRSKKAGENRWRKFELCDKGGSAQDDQL